MKIIQVAPKYFPNLGGVEEAVKQYSERLVQLGHQVTVITEDAKITSQGQNEKIYKGVKIKRCSTIFSQVKPLVPSLDFPLALIRENADIIHLHANKYFTSDCGALIAKLKNIPFVFSPHAGTFGKNLFGKIHNQTIGRLALSANCIIAVSNYEKKLLEQSGLRMKRIEVLPNGVDLDEFNTVNFNVFNRYNFSGRPIALFVGRLAEHKGLDTLINAAEIVKKQFPDIVFFIAGPDGGYQNKLQTEIKKKNLEKNFFLAGYLGRDDLISIYKNATLFCLPSRSEAFGIVVIEAMTAGLPVIVSDLEVFQEIIDNGEQGFILPQNNSEMLAQKIVELINNEDLRKIMGENGRKKVKEKCQWDYIVRRLEKIYQKIV